MGTHSSILAWRIPWTEEPVSYTAPVWATAERVSKSQTQLKQLSTPIPLFQPKCESSLNANIF